MTGKMKILLLSDTKLLGMSGIETHMSHLHKLLLDKGHDVEWYAPDYKPKFIWRFMNIGEGFKIAEMCKKNNYDVIHFHMIDLIVSPFFMLLIPRRVKVFFTVHDYRYYCPKLFGVYKGKICKYGLTWKCMIRQACKMHTELKSKFLRTLKATFLTLCVYTHNIFFRRYVDYFIIPPSDLMLMSQQILKGAKGKMIHMPHFMPALSFTEIDRSLVNPKQFLFVGRLAEEKGVDILIRAVKRLVRDKGLKDLRLKIAGDGLVTEKLKKMVLDLNLNENVEFLGAMKKSKLDALYQESIAAIFPSAWLENTPNVAYEAMRNATPILASNVGGFINMVKHGETGYLFEMGDSIKLAEYMNEFYDNPELSRKMGDAGLKRLQEEFNSEIYYGKYEQMLAGTL